jgi:hypothetical protein
VSTTHANGKKALFMINGTDANFTSATNSSNLSRFVSQIVSVVNTYGYDGVEIDWEPPSSYTSTQQTQFHNLLVALRQSGNLASPKLLAADTKSSAGFYAADIAYFDWLDIMTYDNVGVYNNITWHNAPIPGSGPYQGSTVAAIMQSFTSLGIPASKLNVGLPFYGYVWTGACQSGCTAGLTGPLQRWATGTPSLTFRQYFELAKTYGNPPGSTVGTRQWDSTEQVSYLSVVDNSNHNNDQFVTYDDAQAITEKVNWAKANGFGWFVWAINYAYSPSSGVTDNALLNAIANAWGASTATAPSITSTSPLSSGVTGVAYNVTLSAGGTAPINWSVTSGALPSGLSLNSSTGVVSGTPGAAGASTFTIQASNTAGAVSQAFSVTINPAVIAPTITTTTVPGGTVGAPYTATLTADGTAPITWSVSSGTLPSGLLLNGTTGTISGTPAAAGASTFTISAANSGGTATAQFSINVVYDPYSNWTFNDGTGTSASDASGNAHPAQLVNNPAWQSSGNCKIAGCIAFDGMSQYGTAALDLSDTSVVTLAFWMNWTSYANDDRLAFEFGANFNNASTGFMVDPNSSAAGGGQFEIGLLGNGGYNQVVFARPTAGWHHYAFVFNKAAAAANEVTPYVDGVAVPYTKTTSSENTNNFAADTLFFMSRGGSGLFGSGSLDDVRLYKRALGAAEIQTLATVQTNAPVAPVITTSSLPGGTVSTPYSATITASATGATWSVIGGSLPAGLSLNSSTGVISGTPASAGTFAFTVQASVSGSAASAQLSIAIVNAASSAGVSGPTVAIATPQSGSTVRGATQITVSTSAAVTSVQYRLDGAPFAFVGQAPFSYTWNTSKLARGQHTLDALAWDSTGTQVVSAPVTITH